MLDGTARPEAGDRPLEVPPGGGDLALLEGEVAKLAVEGGGVDRVVGEGAGT